MASICITIRIHSKWLSGFRSNGTKLCCAFGFSADESKVEYNVISWAEEPTPVNTIVWSEKYYIAACKHGIELGSIATPNTTAFPITAGDTLSVDRSWTVPPVQVSQNPAVDKPEAFWFENRMPASAMVFKRIRNRVAQAYVLSMGPSPMPAGKYNISPSGNVAIFFSKQQAGAAFTMDAVPSASCILRYKAQTGVNLWYTESGEWQVRDMSSGVAPTDGLPAAEDWTKSSDSKL